MVTAPAWRSARISTGVTIRSSGLHDVRNEFSYNFIAAERWHDIDAGGQVSALGDHFASHLEPLLDTAGARALHTVERLRSELDPRELVVHEQGMAVALQRQDSHQDRHFQRGYCRQH